MRERERGREKERGRENCSNNLVILGVFKSYFNNDIFSVDNVNLHDNIVICSPSI